MMFMDLLTLMTGWWVWRDTRSAVRWRVPVSSVGSDGSGMSCTAARVIVRASASSTMAPSIFDSSRSRVAEKATSSTNPPLVTCST